MCTMYIHLYMLKLFISIFNAPVGVGVVIIVVVLFSSDDKLDFLFLIWSFFHTTYFFLDLTFTLIYFFIHKKRHTDLFLSIKFVFSLSLFFFFFSVVWINDNRAKPCKYGPIALLKVCTKELTKFIHLKIHMV